MEVLINHGSSVGARGYCNRSPAHWAAARGHTECLNLLFSKGAVINARDSYDITPTHLAAEHGHYETLKLLLDKNAKVNLKDDYGWTPAHWASGRGFVKCLRLLVSKDHLICQLSPPSPPIRLASKGPAENIGRDKSPLRVGSPPSGSSNCTTASSLLNGSLSRTFSPCGSNSLDDHNSTPLHRAAATGNFECVQVLLENNCPRLQRIQEHLEQTGWSKHAIPPHQGSESHISSTMTVHMSSKGLITHSTSLGGCSASALGSSQVAPKIFNSQAAHYAHNYPCLCRVSIDISDDMGMTPLFRAASKGHTLIVRLLIKYGACLKHRDHSHNTVLHQACYSGNVDLVKVLIDYGVDCSARNSDMMTAMDILHHLHSEELFLTVVKSPLVSVIPLQKENCLRRASSEVLSSFRSWSPRGSSYRGGRFETNVHSGLSGGSRPSHSRRPARLRNSPQSLRQALSFKENLPTSGRAEEGRSRLSSSTSSTSQTPSRNAFSGRARPASGLPQESHRHESFSQNGRTTEFQPENSSRTALRQPPLGSSLKRSSLPSRCTTSSSNVNESFSTTYSSPSVEALDVDSMPCSKLFSLISERKVSAVANPPSLKQLCRQTFMHEKLFLNWQGKKSKVSTPTSLTCGSMNNGTTLLHHHQTSDARSPKAGSVSSGLRELALPSTSSAKLSIAETVGSVSHPNPSVAPLSSASTGFKDLISCREGDPVSSNEVGAKHVVKCTKEDLICTAMSSVKAVTGGLLDVTASTTLGEHPHLRFVFPMEVLDYLHG